MDRPLVVAHRAKTPGYPVENALSAIQRAADAGADLAELDIRLSLDRRAVVLHDAFLGRTTVGRGWVGSYPARFLRRLRLRANADEQLPLLRDLLSSLPASIQPALHLKDHAAIRPVLADIGRHGDPSRTWLWLDRLDHVRLARGRFPTIHCTYLPTQASTPAELTGIFPTVRAAGADAVGIDATAATAALVADAARHELRLTAMLYDWQWELLPDLLATGVGGVITTDPARVRAAIAAP